MSDFSEESQENDAEKAGYFYHQIIKKDAEIERLQGVIDVLELELSNVLGDSQDKDAEIERFKEAIKHFHCNDQEWEALQESANQDAAEMERLKAQHEEMLIGPYALSLIWVPEGSQPPFTQVQHVMIRHQSGEAMSVRESVFAELIGKFYKENF